MPNCFFLPNKILILQFGSSFGFTFLSVGIDRCVLESLSLIEFLAQSMYAPRQNLILQPATRLLSFEAAAALLDHTYKYSGLSFRLPPFPAPLSLHISLSFHNLDNNTSEDCQDSYSLKTVTKNHVRSNAWSIRFAKLDRGGGRRSYGTESSTR